MADRTACRTGLGRDFAIFDRVNLDVPEGCEGVERRLGIEYGAPWGEPQSWRLLVHLWWLALRFEIFRCRCCGRPALYPSAHRYRPIDAVALRTLHARKR